MIDLTEEDQGNPLSDLLNAGILLAGGLLLVSLVFPTAVEVALALGTWTLYASLAAALAWVLLALPLWGASRLLALSGASYARALLVVLVGALASLGVGAAWACGAPVHLTMHLG